MKKYIYILFIICAAFFEVSNAHAQLQTNLARVNITNKMLTQTDAFEFELRLIRKDPVLWDKWVDGTFQMALISAEPNGIDYNNILITLKNDSTDLSPLYASSGNSWAELPTSEYNITPDVVALEFGSKISITIAGPEKYDDCIFVPYSPDDTVGILLGKFEIRSKDGSPLPTDLDIQWLAPYDYYQACAYKRKKEDDNPAWHNVDPNLPMQDYNLGTTVTYDRDNNLDTCFIVKNFKSEYEGNFLVRLSWDTECEYWNNGFILVRGMRPPSAETIEEIPFTDTVAHFEHSAEELAVLKGLGTAKPGKPYIYEYDKVDRVGEDYCYKLVSKDFAGNYREHGYTCLYVPNTVISFASAIPNPFKSKTLIKYRLEHDVRLTVTIRDLNGKAVRTVYENKIMKAGWYNDLYFEPTDLAQQGLYDIIFIAYPVEDINIEIARAVVKAMYVK